MPGNEIDGYMDQYRLVNALRKSKEGWEIPGNIKICLVKQYGFLREETFDNGSVGIDLQI
jgi:hypothetical protein